jgi:hypothetical protein
MSDQLEKEYLESIINYYKTKAIQLEYDFVAYKVKTEQQIRESNKTIQFLIDENQRVKHGKFEKEKVKNKASNLPPKGTKPLK